MDCDLEEVVDDDVPCSVVLSIGGGGPPVTVEDAICKTKASTMGKITSLTKV